VGLAVRIIVAASILALFAAHAMPAENLVIDDTRIQYNYTFQTLGSQHFCDLATTIIKAPLVIKLTAAFVTDDAKPKDQQLTVAYIVEAFVTRLGKNSQLESQQVKVAAGRIISDVFNTDLHASKTAEQAGVLGASYIIPSEGSLALFMNALTIRGTYTLAVEVENHSMIIAKVRPTPEIFDPSEKWNKCSLALMQQRPSK
jgi:hypothetical protein